MEIFGSKPENPTKWTMTIINSLQIQKKKKKKKKMEFTFELLNIYLKFNS